MKRVDFENGTITGNILGATLPMLVAQILNLLYNIVDRIYIARIRGNDRTRSCRTVLSTHCHHHRIFQPLRKWWCPSLFYSERTEKSAECKTPYGDFVYHALLQCGYSDGNRTNPFSSTSDSVWRIRKRTDLRSSLSDALPDWIIRVQMLMCGKVIKRFR